MRKVERKPAGELGTQRRLAERIVHEAYLVGAGPEIPSQDRTKHSVRDNETLPVTRESKTRAAVSFVTCERRPKGGRRLQWQVQMDAPDLHLVRGQVKQRHRPMRRRLRGGPRMVPCRVRCGCCPQAAGRRPPTP